MAPAGTRRRCPTGTLFKHDTPELREVSLNEGSLGQNDYYWFRLQARASFGSEWPRGDQQEHLIVFDETADFGPSYGIAKDGEIYAIRSQFHGLLVEVIGF